MITNLIGSPLHDGQWDASAACTTCGKRDQLKQIPGRHTGIWRPVCHGCLERALKSLGSGVPSLNIIRCIACPNYAVAAIFPFRSFAPPPYWLGCTACVNDALDALDTERTAA